MGQTFRFPKDFPMMPYVSQVLQAESSSCVAKMSFAEHLDPDTRRNADLVYELLQGDVRLSMGMVSFVPSKHLDLPDPGLSVAVEEADARTRITVSAEGTARFVRLEVPGHQVRFSDNWFDLPAGRSVTVMIEDNVGLSTDEIRGLLTVTSLRDSY